MKNSCTYKAFLTLFLIFFSFNLFSDGRAILVEGLNKVSGPLWKNTWNGRQRDQLYEPEVEGEFLSTRDYKASLFFFRSHELDQTIKDCIQTPMVEDILSEVFEEKFAAEGRFSGTEDIKGAELANIFTDVLGKMTFQEHRLGASLRKEWCYRPWFFSATTWAGLAERNYWLTEEQREELGDVIAVAFPELVDAEIDLNDFMSLLWGLGDVHCRFGYVFDVTKHASCTAGVRCVLPTAFKENHPPRQPLAPVEVDEMKDFFVDRMKQILLVPRLGNGGHFALGAWSHFSWKKDLKLLSKSGAVGVEAHMLVDYYLPTFEHRFITRSTKKKVPSDGESIIEARGLSFSSTDEQLRQYMGRFLLPEPVELDIAPGVVVKGGVVARLSRGGLSLSVGYDGYYKEAERVLRFKQKEQEAFYVEPKDLGHSIVPQAFSVHRQKVAKRRRSAEQHKATVALSYDALCENVNLIFHTVDSMQLSVACSTSFAFNSSGMGDDFLIALSAGCAF